jgi:hypothetical protein
MAKPQPLPPWLRISTAPASEGAIDGRASRTRAAFLDEAARALRFPDYFRRNWDAFNDCVDTISPVVVQHAEELLVEEPPRQLAILLEVLAEHAAPGGLTLVLHTETECEMELRKRIVEALASGD